MSVQVRQRVEKQILTATIEALFADPRGFSLAIDLDGDDTLEWKGKDKIAELLDDADACDDARIYVGTNEPNGEYFGWVYFVWGNSGWDCLSDYTTNLESVLVPISELQDKLEEEYGDQ